MPITRRKFLKFLAVGLPAATIAPAAVANLAAEYSKTVTFGEMAPDHSLDYIFQNGGNLSDCYHVWHSEWITIDELRARFPARLDKNPLFRGELGTYQGVTIHDHK